MAQKCFSSLFSHRRPNSVSVTYLISPFFIENVKDIRLFQIERMLTQAISVCRWSWKEDWAEFLIHHSTLATTAILLFNQIAFFMDQSPIILMIFLLSPLHCSLCVGVNKKPLACQNPSRQEFNHDRQFHPFSHLTDRNSGGRQQWNKQNVPIDH